MTDDGGTSADDTERWVTVEYKGITYEIRPLKDGEMDRGELDEDVIRKVDSDMEHSEGNDD